MNMYELFAVILIGISHVFLYFQLIRYQRLSYPMVTVLSVVLTILIGTVVTVTGYPEFNVVLYLIFLLSLGLMQREITFMQNLYFTLASLVSVTLVKMVLMELGVMLFMWSPLNLYLWTGSVIHLITAVVILTSIVLLRKQIRRFAQYMIESRLYYVSYGFLIVGLILLLVLTMPATQLLGSLYQNYGEEGYIAAFILFFILLLVVLIGSHLTRERLVKEQQDELDRELLDYIEKLEVMHDELANFRHDYINVLLTLDEAVRTKDMEQIEQIYRDVIAPTSKLMNNHELDIIKLSHINIPEVKSLLSAKLIDAQHNKIHVMIDIPNRVEKIAMPMVDFIRIISILIDNGIEEAIHSDDRIVQLAFFEMEDHQYFIVRNSSEQRTIHLEKVYEKSYSSKTGNRGYGLYSLKQMIDDIPNVTLETSFQENLFTQTLLIKK